MKSILDLPDEIFGGRVSKFLTLHDVLTFQSTCSQALKSMSHKIIHNIESNPIEEKINFYDCSDDHIFFKRIDPLFFDQTHSIIFTCDFKDQGWGNRKSFFYIKDIDVANLSKIKESGRTICTSHLAEHKWSKLRLEFVPQPGKVYSLWYKVGGGGGHELEAKNVKFRSLVYDTT